MDFTLLYLHGFCSSGQSSKAKVLQMELNNCKVITPTLDADPRGAIVAIEKIIAAESQRLVVVGSSLGGFYADYCHAKFGIPCVLVNPLVDARDMAQFLGRNRNFYTGEEFEFTNEQLDFLIDLQKQKEAFVWSKLPELILIAMDDEVLDPHKSLTHFHEERQKVIAVETGGHQFLNEELIVSSVKEMLDEAKASNTNSIPSNT